MNGNNERSNTGANIGFRSALRPVKRLQHCLMGQANTGLKGTRLLLPHRRKIQLPWGRKRRTWQKGLGERMYEIMQYHPGMTVLDGVYDGMCSLEDLYLSFREARKGKRYKRKTLAFTDDLENQMLSIKDDLESFSYEMGAYNMFYVHEPKLRLVMSICFRDRIVQWSIYRRLYPFYDKLFIGDSYACRKGKGSHKAADKLQYWMRQASRREKETPGVKWYYLKLDVSKYFYRVSHEVLVNILRVRIRDERFIMLLEKIINNDSQKFGLPAGYAPEDCGYDDWLFDVGMPIGNITSQMFANIYLNELDQFGKHTLRARYYIRYMDDVIILSDSKEELNRWKTEIDAFLRDALRLNLNKKTAIRPISLGVDFVGYRIWATHRKLKKSTARKIIRKVQALCLRLAAGEISRAEFDRKAASYNGVLRHCDSHGLRDALNDMYTKYNVTKDCGSARDQCLEDRQSDKH